MHPHYVAVVRYGGIFNTKIIAQELVKIEPSEVQSLHYLAMSKALLKIVEKPEWRHCYASIVLSGHFTKLRIAKWSNELSQNEHKSLVKHQLETLYGGETKYQVFLSSEGFGKSNLAFGVDSALLQELAEVEKKANIKIRSIAPYFSHIVNYWRKKIYPSACIVINDHEYIYMAKIVNQSWEIVKVNLVREDFAHSLEAILKFELLLGGNENEQLFYHAVVLDKNKSIESFLLKIYSKNFVTQPSLTAQVNDEFSFARYLK